jgi:selenocysteine-specific elongation factor
VSRHVVIGTAGHVDHGKTALVKTLTGTDTDRWEEEKRRGITIDLGFAMLDLGGGFVASIVDVPGHEDFVRNMVAGATGIDVALLVVAADEGVMPQTEEHLAILEFLRVRSGVVAITKVDLSEPDWLELVETDVTERLVASSIGWESPVRFSAVSGTGAAELIGTLKTAAARAVARSADDLFRMPVDRVFSVAGAGTVVTGTTWSGSVGVGDEVRVLPGDGRSGVRSVEVHGEARERAEPGRRTALALRSLEKTDLARGAVVVADPTWRETWVVDAIVTLLDSAPRPLTQRSRIRLHIGTAEILARVTPAEGEIAPGQVGGVRLRLEKPLVTRWGDRGVVRSYSPMHTVGGCVVIDPWPPQRPRRPIDLQARAATDPVARTRALVALEDRRGVGVADLPVRLGIHPGAVESVVGKVVERGVLNIEGRLLPQAVVEASRRQLEEALARLRGLDRARGRHGASGELRAQPLREAAGVVGPDWHRAVRCGVSGTEPPGAVRARSPRRGGPPGGVSGEAGHRGAGWQGAILRPGDVGAAASGDCRRSWSAWAGGPGGTPRQDGAYAQVSDSRVGVAGRDGIHGAGR